MRQVKSHQSCIVLGLGLSILRNSAEDQLYLLPVQRLKIDVMIISHIVPDTSDCR